MQWMEHVLIAEWWVVYAGKYKHLVHLTTWQSIQCATPLSERGMDVHLIPWIPLDGGVRPSLYSWDTYTYLLNW